MTVGENQVDRNHKLSAEDRLDIIEAISLVTMYGDNREFEKILPLFTEDAVMDYSDVFGEENSHIPVATFFKDVESFIPGFDTTQHLITNFDIVLADDGTAMVRSQIRAHHRIGPRDWAISGMYRHELKKSQGRWLISKMGVRFLFEDGDRDEMMAAAKARVRARAAQEGSLTR